MPISVSSALQAVGYPPDVFLALAAKDPKLEHGFLVDLTARKVLAEASGEEDTVEIPKQPNPEGHVFGLLHNHPGGGTLTMQDIGQLFNLDSREVVAVNNDVVGAFRARLKEGMTWRDFKKVDFTKVDDILDDVYLDQKESFSSLVEYKRAREHYRLLHLQKEGVLDVYDVLGEDNAHLEALSKLDAALGKDPAAAASLAALIPELGPSSSRGAELHPLPFEEAIAWAKSRGVVLPDTFYGQLQGFARAQAFSIAGIASLDQLTAAHNALTKALESGSTLADWKKGVAKGEIPIPGLPAHRLENIFRTNLQGAYGRGRCEQQHGNIDTRPWLMYDAVNDSRTRPAHAAMDGFVARHDDPIWKTWRPPCGYQCRCRLIALTERQVEKYQKADQRRLQDTPGLSEARMQAITGGPDAGWDYDICENPGEGVDSAATARKDNVLGIDSTTSPEGVTALKDHPVFRAGTTEEIHKAVGAQAALGEGVYFGESVEIVKGYGPVIIERRITGNIIEVLGDRGFDDLVALSQKEGAIALQEHLQQVAAGAIRLDPGLLARASSGKAYLPEYLAKRKIVGLRYHHSVASDHHGQLVIFDETAISKPGVWDNPTADEAAATPWEKVKDFPRSA
jgi:SPP1 gp7 family putative phage head morphogenesis protein